MKNTIKSILVFAFIIISQSTNAQAYEAAVGGRLGSFFTGSYKMFVSESNAIEAIAGFDRVADTNALVLGGFYQLHNDLNIETEDFQWFYGVGGFVSIVSGSTAIVPSGIVGIEYTMTDAPVNFFIDAMPGLAIGNGGTDFQINGSIGARYILSR